MLVAGSQQVHEDVTQQSTEDFDRTMKVNLYAMFWLVREAVPHMAPGSAIVTTSSVSAYQPQDRMIDYAATKAAIITYTNGLARQLAAKGIRANTVVPGPVWTPLQPISYPGDEIAAYGQDTPFGRPGAARRARQRLRVPGRARVLVHVRHDADGGGSDRGRAVSLRAVRGEDHRPGRRPSTRARRTSTRCSTRRPARRRAGSIEYYERVAPWMIPHVKDRPVTRKRWANGVDGKVFFEKNLPDSAPDWVRHHTIEHSDHDNEYPIVDDLPTLVWMAQQAALELHVPQWRFGPRGGSRTRTGWCSTSTPARASGWPSASRWPWPRARSCTAWASTRTR